MACADELIERTYHWTREKLIEIALKHQEDEVCVQCSMSVIGMIIGEIVQNATQGDDSKIKAIKSFLEGYAVATGGTVRTHDMSIEKNKPIH